MADVRTFVEDLTEKARLYGKQKFRVVDDEGTVYAHRSTQGEAMQVANHFHLRLRKKMAVQEKLEWSTRWTVGE